MQRSGAEGCFINFKNPPSPNVTPSLCCRWPCAACVVLESGAGEGDAGLGLGAFRCPRAASRSPKTRSLQTHSSCSCARFLLRKPGTVPPEDAEGKVSAAAAERRRDSRESRVWISLVSPSHGERGPARSLLVGVSLVDTPPPPSGVARFLYRA
ncbi:hypothetical protein HJG60_011588 [Phyllostomus discolor]|uniref:Uncharacterized protein n=1 Tax=Phyllostomus discolor TaxID=89673 RepID=A0A834E1A1_9CHIR|nr:hypothetical protein HJG60_011588 [Phyllostomus discolor]